MNMFRTRRAQILAVVLALSITGGTVAASSNWLAGEHSTAGARPVAQSAVAADAGVTVRALDATFSGSETMLRVSLEGEPLNGLSLLTFDTQGQSVALDGFQSGPVRVAGFTATELLIQLPVVEQSASKAVVLLHGIRGRSSEGDVTLSGTWSLPLSLPPDLGKLLRTESLGTRIASAAGIDIPIKVDRSTSRTLLTYTLPAGAVELAPPRLTDESAHSAALAPLDAWPSGNGSRVVSFPTTAFGHQVRVEMGPFAIGTDAPAAATVALSGPPPLDKLERNGPRVPASSFSTLDGDSALVRGAAFGRRGDGTAYVAVTLTGNWPDDPTIDASGARALSWRLFDANGSQLAPAFSEENFTKSDTGKVSYGETTLAGTIDSSTRIGAITVLLTREAEIKSARWSVDLSP